MTCNAVLTCAVCCFAVRCCGGPCLSRPCQGPRNASCGSTWKRTTTLRHTPTTLAPSFSTLRHQKPRPGWRHTSGGSCRRPCELLRPSWPHCCSSRFSRPRRLREHAERRTADIESSCARAAGTSMTTDGVAGASCAGARSADGTSHVPFREQRTMPPPPAWRRPRVRGGGGAPCPPPPPPGMATTA